MFFLTSELFGVERRLEIPGISYTAEIKVKYSSFAIQKLKLPESWRSLSIKMSYWTFGEDFRLEMIAQDKNSVPVSDFVGVAEGKSNKLFERAGRSITVSTTGSVGVNPSLFACEPLLAPLEFATPNFSLLIFSQRPVRGVQISGLLDLLAGPTGSAAGGARTVTVTGMNSAVAAFTFSPDTPFPVKLTLAFPDGGKLMDYEVSQVTEVFTPAGSVFIPSQFQLSYFDEKSGELIRTAEVALANIVIPTEPIPSQLEVPTDLADTLYNDDNGHVVDLRATK